MPVAARVVRWVLMSARLTHVQMAAEYGGAAERDRAQYTTLGGYEGLLGFECPAMRANDVSDVEARPPGGPG